MPRLKLLLLIIFASSNAFALDSLSYSGRLVNADGSPVTGNPDIRFNLVYTNAPLVNVCSKLVTGVPLTKGVFHTKLNYTTADCVGGKTLTQVLAGVPANETIAIQVTDVTNSKAYTYQAIHSIPSSIMANMAKTLAQMNATAGQVLTWNGTAWVPDDVTGATGGTVTQVNTGSGLTGGPVETTGTISIASGGVTSTHLANGSVTNDKVASGIALSKLAVGTTASVIMNNGSGLIEVSQL